jgi:hypothetical protein
MAWYFSMCAMLAMSHLPMIQLREACVWGAPLQPPLIEAANTNQHYYQSVSHHYNCTVCPICNSSCLQSSSNSTMKAPVVSRMHATITWIVLSNTICLLQNQSSICMRSHPTNPVPFILSSELPNQCLPSFSFWSFSKHCAMYPYVSSR